METISKFQGTFCLDISNKIAKDHWGTGSIYIKDEAEYSLSLIKNRLEKIFYRHVTSLNDYSTLVVGYRFDYNVLSNKQPNEYNVFDLDDKNDKYPVRVHDYSKVFLDISFYNDITNIDVLNNIVLEISNYFKSQKIVVNTSKTHYTVSALDTGKIYYYFNGRVLKFNVTGSYPDSTF